MRSIFFSMVPCLAILVMIIFSVIKPVEAQVVGIAAVVNDEIVSAYDVKLRQDIILSSAGIKPTKEARRRNRAQVLRALINENSNYKKPSASIFQSVHLRLNGPSDRSNHRTNFRPVPFQTLCVNADYPKRPSSLNCAVK